MCSNFEFIKKKNLRVETRKKLMRWNIKMLVEQLMIWSLNDTNDIISVTTWAYKLICQ